ncbi:MAG: thioredoxin family protein [Deltaproteobacteria bacterium]|nr:thioredoxin family protein [Deltaproteobacteria bacterium]
MDIKVLGPGCASCDGLEAAVMAVLRDVKQIARYGVMATPALVINGRAVCAGKAPSKEQIKARLAELVGRSCEKIVKTH